jgi:hypothetical protein
MKAAQKPGVRKDKTPWIEYGRTEVVKDTLNPQFAVPVDMCYYFEENQPIK